MVQHIKFLVYKIILFLAIRKQHPSSKKILVVKTDEIGDYILWRNCAPFLRSSERFKDYSLTLCGNSAWRTLSDRFDHENFDNYIWLNKKKFKSNMWYRYRFLRHINRSGFEIVINPIYSRTLRIDDSIVKAASAKLNIGMPSNENNVLSFEKGYDKKLYHELADLPISNMFEFKRNKIFIEKVTGANTSGISLAFDTRSLKKPLFPGDYFVVFPGSNHPSRIWQTDNFVETAAFLHTEYKYHAVLCGSAGDLLYTQAFLDAYPYPCTDMTTKTSLTEFLEILAYAKCVISVDTGSVHMAAAVNCPVYAIFNGSQYGRFAPYPKELNKKFYSVYPDTVEKEIMGTSALPLKYVYHSGISYNAVPAKKLITLIKRTLQANQI